MPKLFEVYPQQREEVAIWKMMRHPVFIDFAGNYMLRWVAINIPMNAFGRNGFEGDIDLIYSLAAPPIPNTHPSYIRAFEIKTATVDGNGTIKSLDSTKFEHGLRQCEKLQAFGAEMIFLIDILILEQGKFIINDPVWEKVDKTLADRTKLVEPTSFGYNVKFLQYLEEGDEFQAGMMYPPRDYVLGKHLPIGEPFKLFTDKLAEHAGKAGFKNGPPILFFCKECGKIPVSRTNVRNPVCEYCGYTIPVHD